MDRQIAALAAEINYLLREKGLTISTAESCTGGAISAAITSCPGSSRIFKGAVVAYANEIKESILGVPSDILLEKGAVSEETAHAMTKGVASLMRTDCAIATTGIAGPDGGTKEKPVGTVWVGIVVDDNIRTTLLRLPDRGRSENVKATISKALELFKEALLEK